MTAAPPTPTLPNSDLPVAPPQSAEVPSASTAGVETMSPELVASLRERALGDLFFFMKGVIGQDRLTNRIHRPLCRLLELYGPFDELKLHAPWSEYEAVLRDTFRRAQVPVEEWDDRVADIRARGLLKLLIMLPRTWYKTTLGSIGYPLWRGSRDSNVRILLTQNTATNARGKGQALAGHVKGSETFQQLFPELMPVGDDKWSADARQLHRTKAFAESTYEFAGTNTQVTSRHFDEIIEDDTVAPDKDDLGEESILPSKEDVKQAIGWHHLVPPLLDEYETGRNIVTGTRWFEYDLLRYIMDHEPEFVVYQRAVREDFDGQPAVSGELTWPERFSERALLGISASMGPYLFSCLYMNTPVRSGDMLFLPEWLKVYDTEPTNLMTFTTVDLGNDPADTKSAPDYNVVLTCGKDMTTGVVYVLDYSRARCSPSQTLEMLFAHVEKWHPVSIGIETTGYQKSFMHWMRKKQRETGKYFIVQQLAHNKAAKTARIMGLQPGFSNGIIRLRAHMDALKNELLVFPLGKNDDVLDALSMQLELWKQTPSASEERAELESHHANDASYILSLARKQGAENLRAREALTTRPPPAWGASVPISVFHPEGPRRGLERPAYWGRAADLGS